MAGEPPPAEAGRSSSSKKNVLLATVLGTTIEWYDFNIYSIAAALVLGPHFFPKLSDTAGTIAAFATFAIGFFARPFGAGAVRPFRRPRRTQAVSRVFHSSGRPGHVLHRIAADL
jgi:hypothetical protein